jgi:hypothetical protein
VEKSKHKDAIIVYPYENQKNVSKSWDGNETPQPPVPENEKNNFPSGPIITVTWGKAIPQIKSHKLLDNLGNEVAHMYLTPGTDQHLQGSNTIAMYSHSPLKPNTTYTVKIETEKGDTIEWSFTTAP